MIVIWFLFVYSSEDESEEESPEDVLVDKFGNTITLKDKCENVESEKTKSEEASGDS